MIFKVSVKLGLNLVVVVLKCVWIVYVVGDIYSSVNATVGCWTKRVLSEV